MKDETAAAVSGHPGRIPFRAGSEITRNHALLSYSSSESESSPYPLLLFLHSNRSSHLRGCMQSTTSTIVSTNSGSSVTVSSSPRCLPARRVASNVFWVKIRVAVSIEFCLATPRAQCTIRMVSLARAGSHWGVRQLTSCVLIMYHEPSSSRRRLSSSSGAEPQVMAGGPWSNYPCPEI